MSDTEDKSADEARVAQLQAREAKVASALATGNSANALSEALTNPPFGTSSAEIKSRNATLVMQAVMAVRDTEIKAAVEALPLDKCDVLMKYLYKGFATKKDESGAPTTWHAKLLKFHAVVLERAGVGCIVRAMSKKQVV